MGELWSLNMDTKDWNNTKTPALCHCRTKPTKILFHGFSDHGKTGWILSLRDNYLQNGDVNVLSIEWHIMAITPWYTTAAKLTRYINQLNGPKNSLIYLS